MEENKKRDLGAADQEDKLREDLQEQAVEASASENTEEFQLDEIDFDAAYDRITKEPVADEETRKKIKKVREEALEEEKHLQKIKRKNKTRWLRALLFTLSIIAVSLILAWVAMVGVRDILGFEKENNLVEVEVLSGQNADQIADLLGEKGIISYPWLFKIVVKLDGVGNTFQVGAHEFYPHASYAEIVAELQTSRTIEVTVTEGMNLIEVARVLEEKEVCSAGDFIEAVKTGTYSEEFVANVSENELKFCRMEGYLFPDKYQFYKNDDPQNVAEKFFDNFQQKVSPYFDLMEQKGMTLEETITLASIIQSEAASTEQMPEISSVFHNRLADPKNYPHLETDPTVQYVEDVIKPNIESPNQAMYDAYNTRVCTGLPIGPICNPGLDAIKAALEPASTSYYFFVHDTETGECFYASTYAEHQENCRKLGIENS